MLFDAYGDVKEKKSMFRKRPFFLSLLSMTRFVAELRGLWEERMLIAGPGPCGELFFFEGRKMD